MQELRKFSRQELENLHYSILRELGRYLGIKSPSSSSKEKIIERILDLQEGKPVPMGRSRKGAKVKLTIDLSKFYAVPEDYEQVLGEDKEYDNLPPLEKSLRLNDVKVDLDKDEFTMEGILEILPDGFGFLRTSYYGNSVDDVHVSPYNIKKFNLRKGDLVKGKAKKGLENKSADLKSIILINGIDPSKYARRLNFDALTPYYPTRKITLEREDKPDDAAIRCIDLFSPIGFGQRGLIVAPPKTGKTTLLKKMAQSIEMNYPEAKLMVLLIDERPEEVTDFKRSVCSEVIYSTFDESADKHIKVAETVLSRAKRLVEVGKDVIILLDSITKLTRAYNAKADSGRTLTGGLDVTALYAPKKFFGTARNIEEGGSITIISTALVETGSRMDDVIFEEFKGTGNMEINLSRSLSEKRFFPAIDLYKSGTRKDDLLLSEKEYTAVSKIRLAMAYKNDATENVIDMMKKTKTNAEFVEKAPEWIKIYKGQNNG